METSRPVTYVASLDGVRTFAVGLVIAFHLWVPGAAAGFAGVDVFFVLSGYLITAGLLTQVAARGRPGLARFWQRRFQRLLPAATLVLLAVLGHATFLAPVYRREALAGDVSATVVYVANWHFMGGGTYFSSDGSESPLLHMWSLAVEEQFYLAWPLLLALVAWLAPGRIRKILLILAGVLAAASALALPLLEAFASQDRAYMGTDSKAFEPLLGVLVAVALHHPRVRAAVASRHRRLATGGLVLAVAVLPWLAGPSAFYFRGGALLLSLGIAALVAGLVTGEPTALSRLLGWGPIAYLGRISYGLYLWHWPWAVWLGATHGVFQPGRAALVLAATLACAVASYHLVEQPIRRGRLGAWLTARRCAVGVAIVMATLLGAAGVLRATQGHVPQDRWLMITGDSVPLKLMGHLDGAAARRGWALDHAARGGCTPLAVELQEYRQPPHEGPGDCRMLADLQTDLIERRDPEVVVWWSRYETHQRWSGDRLLVPEEDEFWTVLEAEARTTVDRLASGGATVVIVQPERPGPGLLAKCPVGAADCFPLDDYALNHDELRQRWNDMVVRIAAADDRVETFRMDPVFCNDPEPNPPSSPAACDDDRDGRTLRVDGVHVEEELFGDAIAQRVIDEALRVAGR